VIVLRELYINDLKNRQMKNTKAGIWIDTEKAVIVFLKGKGHNIKTVESLIEGRERIPGEKKMFSKFEVQFSNIETKKENRKNHEIQNYLKKVVDEIKDTDEVVLFGPAEMKNELEKFMLKKSIQSPVIRRVETTDSMTQNQIVAWVKSFYEDK